MGQRAAYRALLPSKARHVVVVGCVGDETRKERDRRDCKSEETPRRKRRQRKRRKGKKEERGSQTHRRGNSPFSAPSRCWRAHPERARRRAVSARGRAVSARRRTAGGGEHSAIEGSQRVRPWRTPLSAGPHLVGQRVHGGRRRDESSCCRRLLAAPRERVGTAGCARQLVIEIRLRAAVGKKRRCHAGSVAR